MMPTSYPLEEISRLRSFIFLLEATVNGDIDFIAKHGLKHVKDIQMNVLLSIKDKIARIKRDLKI
jgi:hypothetical protein